MQKADECEAEFNSVVKVLDERFESEFDDESVNDVESAIIYLKPITVNEILYHVNSIYGAE